MRKTTAALAGLSLAALALTGCSVGASDSFAGERCERPSASSELDEAVSVSGDFGVSPAVEVFTPFQVTESTFADLETGSGTSLTSAQQVMVVDIALFDGTTGDQIIATEFNGDLTRMSNIASWSQQIPGVAMALECATSGSRVLAAITAEDFGPSGIAEFGLDEDSTVVAVIDVLDTKLARATGSVQFNDARGLPSVVRAPDGRPGIIVPNTDAPTEQVEQVLIKGDGEEVTENVAVWANFTAVDWETKAVNGTSWDTNPVADLAQSAPTVGAALIGQTVGSQLLVVVPASEMAPATAYVVDILGVTTATGQ